MVEPQPDEAGTEAAKLRNKRWWQEVLMNISLMSFHNIEIIRSLHHADSQPGKAVAVAPKLQKATRVSSKKKKTSA